MTHPIKVLQVAAIDTTVHFFLRPLMQRLRSEDLEVHVACSSGPYLRMLGEDGYLVHPLPIARAISPLSNMKSLWRLYSLLRRERFTIVHVHTPMAAALGRVAARLSGIPIIIYTAHGFYFHELMPRWERRAIIWIERWLGSLCKNVLFTVSAEDARTAVQERIAPEERVIWVGNGVDPRSFGFPPDENLRIELGLPPDSEVIGFVGRLVQEKGVEELFRAMKEVIRECPTARLLVVGDTLESDRDRRMTKQLKDLIAHLQLQDRVICVGFRDDVPALLALMDVFVLPSHREGMPITILEAMAAGKPVIATNIRGCREEVIPGVTGLLVPVRDSTALAKAILAVLSNQELSHRMGEAGRMRVETEFDEAAVLQRQIEVYRKLLASSNLSG